jgi:hypothetical protein
MQLSLFHPLGTMSHRVLRGTWNKKIKIITGPEREAVVSKSTEDETKIDILKLNVSSVFINLVSSCSNACCSWSRVF